MLLSMVSLFVSLSWADGACLDPSVQVDLSRQALLEARMDDADALMNRAVSALGCAPVPTPEALAGMWLTYGTLLYFREDKSGAQRAFAAAHRASPTTWYPELGYELRTLYDRAASADQGTGTLRVENLSSELKGVLDGHPARFPQEVASGPHLVQFLERSTALDARLVTVSPGETFLIDAALLQPDASPQQAAAPADSRRRWGLLVAGGVSAVAAGGSYALARQQSTSLEAAPDLSALDTALGRQRLYAGATYGLSGLALTGVGLFIAL